MLSIRKRVEALEKQAPIRPYAILQHVPLSSWSDAELLDRWQEQAATIPPKLAEAIAVTPCDMFEELLHIPPSRWPDDDGAWWPEFLAQMAEHSDLSIGELERLWETWHQRLDARATDE